MLIAGNVTAEEHSSQRIGLTAGPTYGMGLSYGRLNGSTGTGWQVSGFPVWLEEDRLLFGGFTFFKILHQRGEEGVLSLFLSGGLAAFYSWHENGNDDREIDENLTLVAGPGVGLKLRLGPFGFSADLPFAVFLSNDRSKDRTTVEMIPYIPNLACFYRW